MSSRLSVKLLSAFATIPTRANPTDAGLDLCSAEEAIVPARSRIAIGTAIQVAIPVQYVGLICPRSGLSFKSGITVHNGPGIIDSDYRGEIKAILQNDTDTDYHITTGARIAQLVIVPVALLDVSVLEEGEEWKSTARGENGFGSTGV